MIEVKTAKQQGKLFKKLLIGYYDAESILSEKAFENYSNTHSHIYVVITKKKTTFAVCKFFDDTPVAILQNIEELDKYFEEGKCYEQRQ